MPSPLGGFDYTWPYIACFFLAYLLGSIPFGLVLTRLAGTEDIRKLGSGNIGATNVLRTGRKDLAAATLLLDGGKGWLAVWLASGYGPDMMVYAGGGVMVGHCFSIWLKGRGGKGVATAFGVLLAMSWEVGLAAMGLWAAVAAVTRFSSLAGVVSTLAAPWLGKHLATQQFAEFFVFVSLVVLIRHFPNLRRLLRGEESRIGEKKAPPGEGGGKGGDAL